MIHLYFFFNLVMQNGNAANFLTNHGGFSGIHGHFFTI